jgi:beta-galactosidase
MGTSYQVGRFLYQGRQDMTNGRVARFEFYVSDNLEDWGNPVCQGHLESSTNVQEIELASPKRGRYFRFVALSTHDGMQYVSTAELGIVPVADSKLVAKKRRK